MTWLVVGAGGAIGAILRHLLNSVLQGRYTHFPVGIFVVNVLGCLAVGFLAGIIAAGRAPIGEVGRLFLIVGVLGGFTTFSAFGLDTLLLARSGHPALALLNAGGQVVVSLAAVWVGFSLGAWRT